MIKIYAQWIDASGGINTEFVAKVYTGMEVHSMVNRDAEMFYGSDVTLNRNGNVYYVSINGKVDQDVWYLLEEEE